jgi:hypothetical protein
LIGPPAVYLEQHPPDVPVLRLSWTGGQGAVP